MKYKFLDQMADMKFQAFGKNIEEAFENSALALKEIITKDKIKPEIKKIIKSKGKDNESLLYNFLEEFLFLIDTENFILSKVDLIKTDLKKFELNAIVYGDNIKKYKAITDIKAITYNNMFVKGPSKDGSNKDKTRGKWIIQVVVDV